MFWQIILGVALLIGLCVTIYYARQLTHAAINANSTARPSSVQAVPTQHANTLEAVRAVYSGAEGELWELLMGQQIHIGGFKASADLESSELIGGLRT
jgi:hypothetical protein